MVFQLIWNNYEKKPRTLNNFLMIHMKKIKNKFKNAKKYFRNTTVFLFLNYFYFPLAAFAVDFDLTPPGIGGIADPATGKITATTPDFLEYLNWLYKVLLGSTGILALIMIVAGGIMYIFAGASGKPQDVSKAKTMILSAIAGLLLALGSWIILNTINPDLLKNTLNLP